VANRTSVAAAQDAWEFKTPGNSRRLGIQDAREFKTPGNSRHLGIQDTWELRPCCGSCALILGDRGDGGPVGMACSGRWVRLARVDCLGHPNRVRLSSATLRQRRSVRQVKTGQKREPQK